MRKRTPEPQNVVLKDPLTSEERQVVLPAPLVRGTCHHTPKPHTVITITDPTTGQKEEISIPALRQFCAICGRYYT